MMTPKTKIAINVVAVAVLAVGMVAWVLLELVGGGIVNKPFTVTADFAESGGVFTNQEVTYRGVLIGKVGDLSLNEDGVDVQLLIEADWEDRIPADVAARVSSKSAVGEQFVDLTPIAESDEFLSDGDEIPRNLTSLPVDFQRLLQSLDNVLADVPPGSTRRLIENLAGGLGGREDELATILESLGTLSESFASVGEEQKSLLDNSTVVASEFLRTKDEFAAAIDAADEVFEGLGDEPEELRSFLAANDRLAREGIRLLARRGNDLRAGISALADFTSYQLDERVSLEQTLTYVPQFLKAIEEASVPWQNPDGSTFYRIRIGLVYDNVKRSWPCKYENPVDYERLPHLREARRTDLRGNCLSPEDEETARAMIDTLRAWADEDALGEPVSLTGAFGTDRGAEESTDIAFVWPLDGYISSYFGERDGVMHTGLVIDGASGDPVVAAADGTVTASGHDDGGGYGNMVVVDHGEGFSSLYAHLSALDVAVGDTVEAGDPIGAVGCSGDCSGDHLHFEIRVDGSPVDPLIYLPGGRLFSGGDEAPDGGATEATPALPSPSPGPTPAPDLEEIFGLGGSG
jgi:virulence factor Mce-like protein